MKLCSLVALAVISLCAPCSSYVTPLRNTTDTEVIGVAGPGPRTGKFLFDTLFGLEETAYSTDDEESVGHTNTLKSCDCGE